MSFRNKASGSGKLFSMDLMDESGEIRVTAFKEQCDKFYDYAQVGGLNFSRQDKWIPLAGIIGFL